MQTLSEYQEQFGDKINVESINISIWILAQELGIKDINTIKDMSKKQVKKEQKPIVINNQDETVNFGIFTAKQQKYSFDNFNIENELQKEVWQRVKNNQTKSFIFHGIAGTGKTHLACAVARKQLIAGKRVIITNSFDMITECLSDFLQGNMLKHYKSADLLVIDEFEKIMKNTENAMTIFFNIINNAYENNKQIILITNSKIEDLYEILGERNAEALIDRFTEMGMIVEFGKQGIWESYRYKLNQEENK